MKADLFILQLCDFLGQGDGYYRLHEPSRHLSRLSGTVFADGQAGQPALRLAGLPGLSAKTSVVAVDCHYYHRFLPRLIEAADVLLLPCIHDWDLFSIIEQRRASGRITVLESSDYFFDAHPWDPVGARWQERVVRGGLVHFMGAVDGVQTSVAALLEKWKAGSRRLAVFENQLSEIPPLSPPPSRPLTIGWGGSSGHLADWYHVTPVLEKWLAGHPDVHLSVMTHPLAGDFIRLLPERYHCTAGGAYDEYLRFLSTVDIGLAPLLPSEYNRCRSDVKFLEYASRGIVGIYADLEPYRGSVIHGTTGLLYRTPEELARCLDALYSDAGLRDRIRRGAYDYVVKNRHISQHITKRLQFYQELLRGGARGFEFPEEILAAAERDGRYLQLRPQSPEKTLLAGIECASLRDSAGMLAGLLAEHPDYLAALQIQGQVLNGLREFKGALSCLERALVLNPRSARTLSQMGRARAGLGDAEGARRALESAVEISPLYYPGWELLLGLHRLLRGADGPRWAERAHTTHPYSFTLALAGAALYRGMDAVEEARRVLDLYVPTLTREEMPGAAAAFSRAIMEIAGGLIETPEVLDLLGRACEVFPQSARMADLFGRGLRRAGRLHEARHQHLRALDILATNAVYRAEFPTEDATIHYWEFAERIRRWTGRNQG